MWSTVERLASTIANRTVVLTGDSRQSHQGGRDLRAGRAARSLPANRHLDLLDLDDCVDGRCTSGPRGQLRGLARGSGALVNYVFGAPDKLMGGTRGEVGSRLFLFQVREGRRLVIVKCEKQQLSALATWIAAVIDNLGGPRPSRTTCRSSRSMDQSSPSGEITVGLDEEEVGARPDHDVRRRRVDARSDTEQGVGGGLRHRGHHLGRRRAASVPPVRLVASPL